MSRRHLTGICGLLAIALLAGCSTPEPRSIAMPPIARPALRVAKPHPPIIPVRAVTPTGPWATLRASFAMDDCPAPALKRAHFDTRNKRAFEAHMQRDLPVINYIQRIAAKNHVAGEFVLLPWVESHFHEIRPRRHRAAGMWQIMPATARTSRLQVTRSYDGRLDPVAATQTVMRMLADYHKQLHDWRLVDMAYNAGPYRIRHIVKQHGMPPARPVIPDLPVGRGPRHHLVKLLAIACVIAHPEQFGVKLPTLAADERLQVVKLPVPVHLREVAKLSGLSLAAVRQLNAGYRMVRVSSRTPMKMLLPASAAQSLREGIAAGQLHENNSPAMYIVASGDSLWSIAHRFNLGVHELRQWNGMNNSTLHPGQQLMLEPPFSSG
ncbi:MAG TPA: transglycosylase SLT domain-containing protein [Rhodanobacteraceae bacterium]